MLQCDFLILISTDYHIYVMLDQSLCFTILFKNSFREDKFDLIRIALIALIYHTDHQKNHDIKNNKSFNRYYDNDP